MPLGRHTFSNRLCCSATLLVNAIHFTRRHSALSSSVAVSTTFNFSAAAVF